MFFYAPVRMKIWTCLWVEQQNCASRNKLNVGKLVVFHACGSSVTFLFDSHAQPCNHWQKKPTASMLLHCACVCVCFSVFTTDVLHQSVFRIAAHVCKKLWWQQFIFRFVHIYGALACACGLTSARQLGAEVTSARTSSQGFPSTQKTDTLSCCSLNHRRECMRSHTRDASRAERVITLRLTLSDAGLLVRPLQK